MTDPYKALGVPKDATKAQIRKAYKRAAAKAHPDRPGGDAAKMAELNVAVALLEDDERRHRFDTGGDAGIQHLSPSQRAMEALGSMINAWIQADPQQAPPLIVCLRLSLQKKIDEFEAEISKTKKQVARAERTIKALKRKKGEPLLEAILGTQRAGDLEAIEKGLEKVGWLKLAYDMVNAYEAEKWEPPASPFGPSGLPPGLSAFFRAAGG